MLKPRVEVNVVDGVLVAEFWDCLRLDPVPVRALRQELESHLRRGGRPDLVIDLNGVSFAGSSVLGTFVAIQKDCRSRSGRLLFCNVERGVHEVFRVSNLEPLFQFVADVPEALASLNGSSAHPAPSGPPPETPPAAPSRAPLAGRRRSP